MKLSLLIFIFFALSKNVRSQQNGYFIKPTPNPNVQYSENQLVTPADSNCFEPFYYKIDSLVRFGSGKINIVHIGGSHIQADIYTHQVRKNLQSIQYDMNGGRGLIFPFSMAQTNNPSNFKVSYTGNWTVCKSTKIPFICPLGLTGMALITEENASIQIDINGDSTIAYRFDKLRVYHLPSDFKLSLQSGDTLLTGLYFPELGYSLFNSPDTDKINLIIERPDSTNQNFTLLGLLTETDGPGLVYHAIGVNGASVGSYLACELFALHLTSLEPDLIILSIGTNDANTRSFDSEKYYQEYSRLLSICMEACPRAGILLTVPNDAYYHARYVNQNVPLLRKEIYRLAASNNYGVWDFFSIMGGIGSSQVWYNQQLMRYDRVHFTKEGYTLKGNLLTTALLQGWEKNLDKRYIEYHSDDTAPLAVKTIP